MSDFERLTKTVNGETSSLAVAHSPEQYADYLESIPERLLRFEYVDKYTSDNYNNPKFDKSRFKEAIIKLRMGDISLAAKADKLMDQLKEEGVFSLGIPHPSRAVSGAMAIMPLFEKGIPNCMINRDTSQMRGLNAPLNIYWDRFRSSIVGSSTRVIGGIGSNPVEARGIAITAFVMAMSRFRPVNLYMVNTSCPSAAEHGEQGIYGGLIRMETTPLDLARATWMFTNSNFSELMPWCAMRHQFELCTGKKADTHMHGAYGPIRLRHDANTRAYGEEFRQILGMKTDDILFYGMTLNDPLSYTDPVAWVKRMVKEHTERQATAA